LINIILPITPQAFTLDETALPGEKNLLAGLVALAGGGKGNSFECNGFTKL